VTGTPTVDAARSLCPMTAVLHHDADDADDAIDLPTIDLDATGGDGLSMSADWARVTFEERYAQLAFGLGTVPRRVRPDEPWWVTAPGVLAILAAVLGLLLLAG
jgi:hypothetical protein